MRAPDSEGGDYQRSCVMRLSSTVTVSAWCALELGDCSHALREVMQGVCYQQVCALIQARPTFQSGRGQLHTPYAVDSPVSISNLGRTSSLLAHEPEPPVPFTTRDTFWVEPCELSPCSSLHCRHPRGPSTSSRGEFLHTSAHFFTSASWKSCRAPGPKRCTPVVLYLQPGMCHWILLGGGDIYTLLGGGAIKIPLAKCTPYLRKATPPPSPGGAVPTYGLLWSR